MRGNMKMLNFESMRKKLSDFDESFVFPDMKSVEEYIRLRYKKGDSLGSIAEDLKKRLYKFDVNGVDWLQVVVQLVRISPSVLSGEFNKLYLYEEEVQHLRSVQLVETRKFLYLALIVHKWNNHPSGWVRYEREDFFTFWGMNTLKTKEKESIAQDAVKNGLELRVIGSKEPIICYNVSFRKDFGNMAAMIDSEQQIRDWWEWLGL